MKNNEETKIELLKKYATCFNSLELNDFGNHIHEQVEYSSMWVFETLVWKANFLNYFKAKLNALQKAKETTRVQAKLFLCSKSYNNSKEPCLMISQSVDGELAHSACILIEISNQKISRISLCSTNFFIFSNYEEN